MIVKPGVLALPGDCLLYSPSDLLGLAIAVKTWARVCHVEIYAGDNQSVASRNGIGVNLYPQREAQLKAIIRPCAYFDFKKAMEWFELKARGEKYDWLGLLCFTLAVAQGSQDRMFCSEFATRFYRAGGIHPVNPKWDADKVAPATFLMSSAFQWLWVDGVV